jgi:triacylglycerol lipase
MRLRIIASIGAIAALGFAAPAHAEISNLPKTVAEQIAAMGPHLNPQIITRSFALMRPLQAAPSKSVVIAKDVSYGPDPLQKLDIDHPAKGSRLPVALYVHGGGFVRGDKNDYSNIVAYLAAHGIVAVNMNYRLAPKVSWPAESEDVGAAIAFLKKNIARYGGDPRRIVVIGHSAGANLVASYVLDPELHPADGPGVIGAVLISVPAYRAESIASQDQVYFGKDASLYAKRAPAAYVEDSKTPLMIVTAQFDPVGLAPESYEVAAQVCVRDQQCPVFLYLKGHNHISEVASVGTKDDQLGRGLIDFIESRR